ncbi:MAG: NAD(P)-binding protein [Hyphomicrobiales bacterium]
MNASTSTPRIGVYICHCGMNIAPRVDVEAVAEFARGLDHVVVARDYKFMCSNPGQEFIAHDIDEQKLNRVVVASCSPRMHEPTFRKACEKAGINPYYFQMANIREQVSWVTHDGERATAKAKDQVAAAVARVSFHTPLYSREVPVTKAVLVVGGGIAGMQAAITAAEAGYTVHVVEREPSIGGHMAKFDKTFPSLDCAACIMTPKMVEVGQHEKIRLHTYSEVSSLEGFVGNFRIGIRQKARFVDAARCTGCGLCAEACPVVMPNRFDEGLSRRKAIYRSFPQAVPITFCIDKKDRAPCVGACPAGINVQGYVQLIGQGKYREALSLILEKLPLPGVLGRVCPHPCETACRRAEVDQPVAICDLKRFVADRVDLDSLPMPAIEEQVEKVAVVGSGPAGLTAAHNLRLKGYRVTLFEAHDRLGGMLRLGIPDYRLPGDILDREIGRILRLGVEARTGMRLGQDMTLEGLKLQGYSAVFLGIGAHASLKLGIPGEEDTRGVVDAVRFLREVNSGVPPKVGARVAVIGGGNVAVDAARAARRLGARQVTLVYRRSAVEMPAYPEEIEGAREEGVEFVHMAAPVRIQAEDGAVSGLVCLRTELGVADESGRRRPVPIAGSEFTIDCDQVVAAIGQRIDRSWADSEPGIAWSRRQLIAADAETLQTNLAYVFAGGDAVSGPATVIEAVAAGHRAAESIHRFIQGLPLAPAAGDASAPQQPEAKPSWLDIPADLMPVPRQQGGLVAPELRKSSFNEAALALQEGQARAEAARCLNCGACCECLECVRACEVKAVNHGMTDTIEQVEVGAVIVATGFNAFDPAPLAQYGYGIFPEVYTSLEFERLNNATGPTSGKILMKDGRPPRRVAIVHCVGSRDARHRKYCSRVCCMYSMKFAHLVREKTGAEVWDFYIDIRSPGKLYEEFYNRVQEEGVHLVRGKVAEITDIPDRPEDAGRLVVVAENTLTRRTLRLPVDMVVLSVALEPARGAEELGRLLGLQRDKDGWFNELHVKLAPVKTATSGIFLAGCCQGPKDIPDTVAQASAAAGEAVALLAKGTVRTRAEISIIDPDLCSGCRSCLEVCPYSAIGFDEGRAVAVVNEALCQGCGSCAATCPSSSAGVKHFTDRQIMEELEAILIG